MPARLNRRRYREIVATLKEVIEDKKAPQQRRLRAVETLMEVYARHDRTEAAREARKRSTEGAQEPEQPGEPEPVSHEAALREAQAFLARIGGEKTNATE